MEKLWKWIISYKYNFIVATVGSIIGYLYWFYIGCESGNCAITSVWYRTALYGALMGWLLSDVLLKKTKKKEN